MEKPKDHECKNFRFSKEQQEKIDSLLIKYDSGNMRFSSWDSVKRRIRSRARARLGAE